MKMLSVSLLNGLAVVSRLGALLAINKLLAVSFGPSGYAQYGSFQNLFQIAMNLGMLGLGNGITHFTASASDPQSRQRYWAGAIRMTLGSSGIVALCAFPFVSDAFQSLGPDASRMVLPLIVSLLLPVVCLQGQFQAILNGLGRVNWYVAVNVTASVLTLFISACSLMLDRLEPAMLALPLGGALSLLLVGPLAARSMRLKWSSLWGPMQGEAARHLLAFGVVSMVASCLTPLTQLQIREGIVQVLGSHTAGIWEGAQRLSASYSLVLTSLVGVYFLPRFSRCADGASLFAEMRKAIFLLVPISIAMGLVLYQWRRLAIDTLFNAAFLPMGEMIAVQCVGDTLRIVAWIFAYVMLARRKHLRYLTAEVAFSVVHVALAATLQSTQGLQGLAMAYTVSCAIYVVMVWPAIFKLRGQVSTCPC